MSTATIYAHTERPAHDESGRIGGDEPGVPAYWSYSVRIAREWEADLAGAVDVAAPNPVPQGDFMRALRGARHVPVGLPATRWMAEPGAVALRSDTEPLPKSRRVVPGRLLAAGFAFTNPDWPEAARELVARRADDTPARRVQQ